MIAAELQYHINVLAVLENVVKMKNVAIRQRFMYFNLTDELNRQRYTFCLAFDFLSVYFDTILMAAVFLFYKFYIS